MHDGRTRALRPAARPNRQRQHQVFYASDKPPRNHKGTKVCVFVSLWFLICQRDGGSPKIFCSVWLPSAQANSSDSTPFATLEKVPATFHGPVNSLGSSIVTS